MNVSHYKVKRNKNVYERRKRQWANRRNHSSYETVQKSLSLYVRFYSTMEIAINILIEAIKFAHPAIDNWCNVKCSCFINETSINKWMAISIRNPNGDDAGRKKCIAPNRKEEPINAQPNEKCCLNVFNIYANFVLHCRRLTETWTMLNRSFTRRTFQRHE